MPSRGARRLPAPLPGVEHRLQSPLGPAVLGLCKRSYLEASLGTCPTPAWEALPLGGNGQVRLSRQSLRGSKHPITRGFARAGARAEQRGPKQNDKLKEGARGLAKVSLSV